MSPQNAAGKPLPISHGPGKHKDPVCGMTIAPEKAAGQVEHGGKTYYFCSKGCAERFSREPEKFLAVPGTGALLHSSRPEEHGAMHHSQAIEPRLTSDDKKARYT